MPPPGYTLLTGDTGLTGRYLLRDLTRSGHRVALLTRDGRVSPAADRVAEVVAETYEVTWVVAGNPRRTRTTPGTATVRLYTHWNTATY
jgi:nucleoside-diphosphate-sugar epimerase